MSADIDRSSPMTLTTEQDPRQPGRPPAPPAPAAPADPGQEQTHGRAARLRAALGTLAAHPGLLLAVLYLALILAWTLAPSLFAGTDPLRTDPAASLTPPGADHWFGTDNLGRDLYTRVVHGTRTSLTAALIAVSLSLLAGTVLGVLSGYLGGWVDQTLMRCVEVLIVIPGLLLSLAVVSILGFGVTNVAIAVGISGIPAFARVIRAEVLRIRSSVYFRAAVTSGTRTPVILLRHVLPNASQPVLVLAALEIGGAVLSVSALSFLGYGAAPPAPELGAMVSQGRDYISTAWWLTTFPGLAIALIVLCANRIGRALERTGVR
ncbi:ABC transporter permease [Streptomyces harbinensis]|uniref:Peptide/nickel transport system permease protein n=3 Tax=Streptomyces TaxID=1883 RepID=A0A1I6UQT8_9ACTN|nr:ABC transporter permease [Streptomyces harbinensis]QKV69149.1 ABC transporter permease [Streptomyces harbinensis]SFT03697.1 peptide/nickel transport system permease protein [Streptomyces harbinensis]